MVYRALEPFQHKLALFGHIGRLERPFERSSRSKRAFDQLAEDKSQVTEHSGDLVGTTRLAAPSDLARNTLLPWLNEFLALHPGVELS